MTEYIWFKHSKNRNSIHKRNKNIDKAKLGQLVKDGWVQIVGEVNGVMDRTLIEKPKPKRTIPQPVRPATVRPVVDTNSATPVETHQYTTEAPTIDGGTV